MSSLLLSLNHLKEARNRIHLVRKIRQNLSTDVHLILGSPDKIFNALRVNTDQLYIQHPLNFTHSAIKVPHILLKTPTQNDLDSCLIKVAALHPKFDLWISETILFVDFSALARLFDTMNNYAHTDLNIVMTLIGNHGRCIAASQKGTHEGDFSDNGIIQGRFYDDIVCISRNQTPFVATNRWFCTLLDYGYLYDYNYQYQLIVQSQEHLDAHFILRRTHYTAQIPRPPTITTAVQTHEFYFINNNYLMTNSAKATNVRGAQVHDVRLEAAFMKGATESAFTQEEISQIVREYPSVHRILKLSGALKQHPWFWNNIPLIAFFEKVMVPNPYFNPRTVAAWILDNPRKMLTISIPLNMLTGYYLGSYLINYAYNAYGNTLFVDNEMTIDTLLSATATFLLRPFFLSQYSFTNYKAIWKSLCDFPSYWRGLNTVSFVDIFEISSEDWATSVIEESPILLFIVNPLVAIVFNLILRHGGYMFEFDTQLRSNFFSKFYTHHKFILDACGVAAMLFLGANLFQISVVVLTTYFFNVLMHALTNYLMKSQKISLTYKNTGFDGLSEPTFYPYEPKKLIVDELDVTTTERVDYQRTFLNDITIDDVVEREQIEEVQQTHFKKNLQNLFHDFCTYFKKVPTYKITDRDMDKINVAQTEETNDEFEIITDLTKNDCFEIIQTLVVIEDRLNSKDVLTDSSSDENETQDDNDLMESSDDSISDNDSDNDSNNSSEDDFADISDVQKVVQTYVPRTVEMKKEVIEEPTFDTIETKKISELFFKLFIQDRSGKTFFLCINGPPRMGKSRYFKNYNVTTLAPSSQIEYYQTAKQEPLKTTTHFVIVDEAQRATKEIYDSLKYAKYCLLIGDTKQKVPIYDFQNNSDITATQKYWTFKNKSTRSGFDSKLHYARLPHNFETFWADLKLTGWPINYSALLHRQYPDMISYEYVDKRVVRFINTDDIHTLTDCTFMHLSSKDKRIIINETTTLSPYQCQGLRSTSKIFINLTPQTKINYETLCLAITRSKHAELYFPDIENCESRTVITNLLCKDDPQDVPISRWKRSEIWMKSITAKPNLYGRASVYEKYFHLTRIVSQYLTHYKINFNNVYEYAPGFCNLTPFLYKFFPNKVKQLSEKVNTTFTFPNGKNVCFFDIPLNDQTFDLKIRQHLIENRGSNILILKSFHDLEGIDVGFYIPLWILNSNTTEGYTIISDRHNKQNLIIDPLEFGKHDTYIKDHTIIHEKGNKYYTKGAHFSSNASIHLKNFFKREHLLQYLTILPSFTEDKEIFQEYPEFPNLGFNTNSFEIYFSNENPKGKNLSKNDNNIPFGEISTAKRHKHLCPGCHKFIAHNHGHQSHWHELSNKGFSFCPNCQLIPTADNELEIGHSLFSKPIFSIGLPVFNRKGKIEADSLFQQLIKKENFLVPHHITMPKDNHWKDVKMLMDPPNYNTNYEENFHNNNALRGIQITGLIEDKPKYHPISWSGHALNSLRARCERFKPIRSPFSNNLVNFLQSIPPSFFFKYYGWDDFLIPSDIVTTKEFRKKFNSNKDKGFQKALIKLSSRIDDPKNNAKAMIKSDEQLFRTVNDKDKQARFLCNMNKELLVHQGALANTLENFWRRIMNIASYIFMTSGAMNYEITWFAQALARILSGDVSGMDSSYIEIILNYCIEVAIYPLQNKDYWRPILRRKSKLIILNQEFPKQFIFKFRNDGRLPTGDNMTLLLNCIFCMVIVTLISLFVGKKLRAMIQGDDHAMEEVPGIEKIYLKVCKGLGLKTTYETNDWKFIEYCSLIPYKTKPYSQKIRYRLHEKIIYENFDFEYIHDWKPMTALKSLVYTTDNPVPLTKYLPQMLKSLSFHKEVPVFKEYYEKLVEKYGIADQLENWFLRLHKRHAFKHQHTCNWIMDDGWRKNLRAIWGELTEFEIFDQGFDKMNKLVDIREENPIPEVKIHNFKKIKNKNRRKFPVSKDNLHLLQDIETYIDSKIF